MIEAHDESERGANVVELVATPLPFPGTEPAGEYKHTGSPKKHALLKCFWSHSALAQSQDGGNPCV